MGLFDDEDDELDDLLESVKKYPSCVAELNEGNVQAVFNRCLAKEGVPVLTSNLFPTILGNHQKVGYGAYDFDKNAILTNKANIQYLFGQLHSVHTKKDILTIEDFLENYLGKRWTTERATLLELLYLGKCSEIDLINPFNARKNNTTRFMNMIKPTLSPKDPNFPEWWEKHKSEWEEPKKEGKEPADD